MKTINYRGGQISTEEPLIMGILNATPDSFSDGGQFFSAQKALKRIEVMINEGADIIDLGAESTRPGAKPISADEEIKRLAPLLAEYKNRFNTPLSIDTTKADVAEFALNNGADMINDISGLTADERMIKLIAKKQCPVMIMHMQNTPQTMQDKPSYDNVVEEVYAFLAQQIERCHAHQIHNVIIDPGIGFGKSLVHNVSLLKHLARFKTLEKPILIGTSRKSFIEKITGDSIENRLEGSLASAIAAFLNGASLFRVHDVAATGKALAVAAAIKGAS